MTAEHSRALSRQIVLVCANAALLLVILASTIFLNVRLHQTNAKLAAFNAQFSVHSSSVGKAWRGN